ncbi:MAG TPA: hypothetical protein PLQ34_10085, partial [Ferrovaceae bacterium]|nr:hypothetical protein [Ferrovaceae bacterium]
GEQWRVVRILKIHEHIHGRLTSGEPETKAMSLHCEPWVQEARGSSRKGLAAVVAHCSPHRGRVGTGHTHSQDTPTRNSQMMELCAEHVLALADLLQACSLGVFCWVLKESVRVVSVLGEQWRVVRILKIHEHIHGRLTSGEPETKAMSLHCEPWVQEARGSSRKGLAAVVAHCSPHRGRVLHL